MRPFRTRLPRGIIGQSIFTHGSLLNPSTYGESWRVVAPTGSDVFVLAN